MLSKSLLPLLIKICQIYFVFRVIFDCRCPSTKWLQIKKEWRHCFSMAPDCNSKQGIYKRTIFYEVRYLIKVFSCQKLNKLHRTHMRRNSLFIRLYSCVIIFRLLEMQKRAAITTRVDLESLLKWSFERMVQFQGELLVKFICYSLSARINF